jgi:hypothetical protein
MFRKNTTGQFICFQGVDATTGGIKSGVTWTVRRCIDGTFAAAGGTVTEDSTNGWYKFAMSQADTNGNDISFNFTGSGAVPQTVNIVTTAGDPTDGVRFGLTALPNTAAGAVNGLPLSFTASGDVRLAAGVAHGGANTQLRLDSSSASVPPFYVTATGGADATKFWSSGGGCGLNANGTAGGGTSPNVGLLAIGDAAGMAGSSSAGLGILSVGGATDTDFGVASFSAGTVVPRVTLVDTTTVNSDMLTQANVRTAVGLASANLDTQLAAINSKTTNLPGSPAAVGSPMSIQSGAITDASFTVPSESAGRPSGMLSMIRRIFEWGSNARTRDRSTGNVVLSKVAGGALETQVQSTSGTVDSFTQGV